MSIEALAALEAIGLLDVNDQPALDENTPSNRLDEILRYYRDKRLAKAESDAAESVPATHDLAALLSSQACRHTLDSVLPTCLVHSRVYADDPLFKLAHVKSEVADAYNEALGFPGRSGPSIDSVNGALKFFSQVAPLIRCGALTVLPLSELHETPDRIPVFYSEDHFRSEVPELLHDFVHQSAHVSSVELVEGGGAVIPDAPAESPTRAIYVRFNDDYPDHAGNMYFYSNVEIGNVDRESGIIETKFSFDFDKPIDERTYRAWVYQSVNRSIINRLQGVSVELGVAGQLRASYHTESPFEAKLFGMSAGQGDTARAESGVATRFLMANAPYLRLSDASQLARLRISNPRLFERWQQSLLHCVRELSDYEGDFDSKAKQLLQSEVQPQVDDIAGSLARIGATVAGATLVTSGAIGLALLAPAASPIALVLACGALTVAGESVPTAVEHLQKRKTPAFVWNRLLKD